MRVIPLSDCPPDQFSDLLDEELVFWRRELFWDYQPIRQLIGRYVSLRCLPGFGLVDADRLLGYCYYVVVPPVGQIGSIFVTSQRADRSSYAPLIDRLTLTLTQDERVERVEGQLFPFTFDHAPLLKAQGFVAFRRQFLCRAIGPIDEAPEPSKKLQVVAWRREWFQAAAEVLFDSYSASTERQLCSDYRSRRGCLHFLGNLLEGPGCGEFCRDTSLMAFEGNELVGILVSSRISSGTGMIPQLSVRKHYQGRGAGRALLRSYFNRASRAGLVRSVLSVSEVNQQAFSLYQQMGYLPLKTFNAFLWKKGR